jgi:hypothetical protein
MDGCDVTFCYNSGQLDNLCSGSVLSVMIGNLVLRLYYFKGWKHLIFLFR